APIWMTADTTKQAAHVRKALGGREKVIEVSGSDTQLRFTGLVVRRTAEKFPDVYARTKTVQLISSFIPAVLSADANVPLDFGNGAGMTLMDYRRRQWSDELLEAVSEGLPGGKAGLKSRLLQITAPDAVVGKIARYFVEKYGFNGECLVAAGSGDNPQSKVLVSGDLLSLGSSFVFMVTTDGKTMDKSGAACAMYDGIGRPFMFGCRTNGALVWDQVRALYGLGKEEYSPAEAALKKTPVGENLVLWQPRNESFPASGKFDLARISVKQLGLAADYSGIIESSLAAVYYHSTGFSRPSNSPLSVTGGAAGSPGIMRRIAAIWNRPVVQTEEGGAALGAAVAGISAYFKAGGQKFTLEDFTKAVMPGSKPVQPSPADVKAMHAPGAYLDKFAEEEARLIAAHPLF
ncbi:MAG TPA: FGGY family carbohydrate kinase, partial [Dehalococcoidales bacterium]|nr:FGGY family carbohydrate kinase [Dehalococcoidales bacterium]